MTITNIHHSAQILQYAGRDMVVQAVIANHQRNVLINGREFDQEEVNALAELLDDKRRDMWLTKDKTGNLVHCVADEPLPVPVLYTGPGLDEPRFPTVRDGQALTRPDLAYLIVVRGRSGALRTKTRILYSLHAVSGVMMEEACQGYSVVFSAALLRSEVARLGTQDQAFKQVDSFEALSVQTSDADSKAIRLYC